MFKNFKFIGIICFVLAAMVAFSSCSKPEKTIIGKWKITKASLKIDGDEYCSSEDKGETWVFKDNGKCSLYILYNDYEGKYTVRKNTLTIDVEHDFGEGEVVTLSGDLDIDEINKEEMSISGTVEYRYDDNYYGDHETTKAKLAYEFEKK